MSIGFWSSSYLETLCDFNQGENLNVDLKPIAYLESVFNEKFGIPRQPGIIKEAKGVIRFKASEENKQAIFGLEMCSHLWLLTWFHQADPNSVKPRVRPPRLGGNKTLGVYATRSPFRPNPIALSLVGLESISLKGKTIEILVTGVDLVTGTPLLDIKPYLPYCESLPEARTTWIEDEWKELTVSWAREAENDAEGLCLSETDRSLIEKVIAQDPRPAYQREKEGEKKYGMKVLGLKIKFEIEMGKALILSVQKLA